MQSEPQSCFFAQAALTPFQEDPTFRGGIATFENLGPEYTYLKHSLGHSPFLMSMSS